MTANRTGAEELRLLVANMNATSEAFNHRFTVAELLQLYRMHLASEWDVYPDQWAPQQVLDALLGRPPTWDDDMEPTYGTEEGT